MLIVLMAQCFHSNILYCKVRRATWFSTTRKLKANCQLKVIPMVDFPKAHVLVIAVDVCQMFSTVYKYIWNKWVLVEGDPVPIPSL